MTILKFSGGFFSSLLPIKVEWHEAWASMGIHGPLVLNALYPLRVECLAGLNFPIIFVVVVLVVVGLNPYNTVTHTVAS